MTVEQMPRISILGKDAILFGYDLWPSLVVDDLLSHVTSSTFALITDTNLSPLYVPAIKDRIEQLTSHLAEPPRFITYSISPGEGSKCRAVKARIEDWLLENQSGRDTVLIALGGGVVGDLAGYVASTYMRGIRFVQVPTTLLAMVDSSIGGKTAINTPIGKNLIGSFWQPERIYISLRFLESLPVREFANGMAEIIKVAAIWDERLFSELEENATLIMTAISNTSSPIPPSGGLGPIRKILERFIARSAEIKAHVVSSDVTESDLRGVLNFGHSIGHAIEAIIAPEVLHGEAVSIGMIKEAELSRYLGILKPSAVARLAKCISSYDLPTSLEDKRIRKLTKKHCSVSQILRNMRLDKKNKGKTKRIVLLSGIGRTNEQGASVVDDRDIIVVLSTAIEIIPSIPRTGPGEVIVSPPGSKSISNRAIVLAGLGRGPCRIKNLLHSDDTAYMISAISQLGGASFSWEDCGETVLVNGNEGCLQASPTPLFVGNAGTACRFLTSIASLCKPTNLASSTVLTGNQYLKVRPVGDLVESLRQNGVEITYLERENSVPVKIKACNGFYGGEITLKATLSSQYVSSILMCAPYAKHPVTIRLVGGKPISQPYIDMTISMMADFGIKVIRSETDENTYFVPQGVYVNPPEFTVEPDASSATYPLAIAAITGTTCTVNIASKSLQGDSSFPTRVLRPMGCTVIQNENSVTVTGPPRSSGLKALGEIDMETMTDAFLTATVLAAVANGKTRITGISNQRVKECNRIAAMRIQLLNFGVKCREWDDGIEIEGQNAETFTWKNGVNGVYCYDDHRVAMSFSVLALRAPWPVTILQRRCVEKTWPGWWDTLSLDFGAKLVGKYITSTENPVSQELKSPSLFIIGMRGAGKSTTGQWAAKYLCRPHLDLDEEAEKVLGKRIREFVKSDGWESFRNVELDILKGVVREKAYGHVITCGGGIVERLEARQILSDMHKKGNIVLLVHRSTKDILEYLQMDRTRPTYADDAANIYQRRKPLYEECSNFQYYSITSESTGLSGAKERFTRFLSVICGDAVSTHFAELQSKPRSFFISLTVPDVALAADVIQRAVVGIDAVELRVDLLVEPRPMRVSSSDYPFISRDFLAIQIAHLRSITSLPIIFTIRTISQGGCFPDNRSDEALSLYKTAIRLGIEYIDLEMSFSEVILKDVSESKGSSKIIASHHDPSGRLSWNNESWVPYYYKASEYGDIIKLVGVARNLEDAHHITAFKHRIAADSAQGPPLIAIDMGPQGKLSRVLNSFMTPVSHPALPFEAAPGQMSSAEIRHALSNIGGILPQTYYLFGKPISSSRSPALHNMLFEQAGLPYQYRAVETDIVQEVDRVIRSPTFGGASVTIPLKELVIPLLDGLSDSAQTIGAVNTITVEIGDSGDNRLIGHNTDWMGMVHCLSADSHPPTWTSHSSALIVGTGGTARAAVYALHSLGFSPIYIAARNREKILELSMAFPSTYNIIPLTQVSVEKNMLPAPVVAINTIPADQPIDPIVEEVVVAMLNYSQADSDCQRIFLEMAYMPTQTPLFQIAQQAGWMTIPGLEVLIAQGWYQSQMWTGIKPLYQDAKRAVLGLI